VIIAEAVALAAPMPISILALILLSAWVYPSFYLASRIKDNPSVPRRYKPTVQVVSLFAGPVVFLALVVMNKQQFDKHVNPLVNLIDRAQNTFSNFWHGGQEPEAEDDTMLRLFDSTGAELSEIYGHVDRRSGDGKCLDLTARIIDNALKLRASDILIDPQDRSSYAVRLRIDGALRTVQEIPIDTCKAVINSVKAVSNMDIAERRRPQDGVFSAGRNGSSISFRVASAGALNGEKLSIRVLNGNAGKFTMADVGIPQAKRDAIIEAVGQPSGMVLICGPTGSGKTTTLYSVLNQIDRSTRNVITVEDPIEAHLPGVSQLEINAKADITFAKALRSMLRQDPDVICVGEIRDEETASIALRAAQTGHLVVATIHCDSNATALVRLLDLGVSPELMSAGLSLLISQRLLRKLCDKCKEPARFSDNMALELQQRGLDTRGMFKAKGCERCGGTGYYGRMAVCDLLTVSNELRIEIAQGGAISARLRNEGEKKDRANMKNEALRAVVAGITSLDEIKRVIR
jgi:type II secretory ATPase GspE/PulE/Tfp pilus assembly ATPase PilB-like protein